MDRIKSNRTILSDAYDKAGERLIKMAEKEREDAQSGRRSGMLSSSDITSKKMAAEVFDKMAVAMQKERPEGTAVFGLIKKLFDGENASLKKKAALTRDKLNNTFTFLEEVWSDDNEMVIFVTELTANSDSVRFISRYGCEKYFAHNKELLFYERHKEIIAEIEAMEL